MASTRWACITAISLLLSLGMSAAQRSLLMRGAMGQEPGKLTDFDLHGGIAGTLASSSKGGAMASSDMGSFGQDMPGKARPNHRDLSMVDGWDMDPDANDSGDRPPNAHDNPVVHNEPAPFPRFPDDQYSPPLSQWQGEFMYCSPISCPGRKEDYGAGDCAGFSMLIEYTPPPPLGQPGVSRKPVYSPNGANPDGHAVPLAEPAAFPPESSATETSDIAGGTWEEPTMPGH